MESSSQPDSKQLWILCPPKYASRVKLLLREQGQNDRYRQVISNVEDITQGFSLLTAQDVVPSPNCVAIPTKASLRECDGSLSSKDLCHIGLMEEPLVDSLVIAIRNAQERNNLGGDDRNSYQTKHSGNLLSNAVSRWIDSLPTSIRHVLPPKDDLLRSTRSFHKYTALLIVPSGTFTRNLWREVCHAVPASYMNSLYAQIAEDLHVTHIAEQGAIPLNAPGSPVDIDQRTSSSPKLAPVAPGIDSSTNLSALSRKTSENILRAPLALRPLYGSFGSYEASSPNAFDRALWAHVLQHGIAQEFAPLYTMFANGNVGEKRRLWAITSATKRPERESAVDLFAGIGYFSFSLRKAGYAPVLCWELNGWSLEGLRRGSKKNHWSSYDFTRHDGSIDGEIVSDGNLITVSDNDLIQNDFVLFHESNANALRRIEVLRGLLPPIRHVSCGYLPSSAMSWVDAMRILDPVAGGWIYAHENCGIGQIEERRLSIEKWFQEMATKFWGSSSISKCVHVEHVKTYAPGVMHCVFDMRIEPRHMEVS